MAANLACALAHGSEERILLIEGDLRLPALRQMFGIGHIPGISELIEDGHNSRIAFSFSMARISGFCLPAVLRPIH